MPYNYDILFEILVNIELLHSNQVQTLQQVRRRHAEMWETPLGPERQQMIADFGSLLSGLQQEGKILGAGVQRVAFAIEGRRDLVAVADYRSSYERPSIEQIYDIHLVFHTIFPYNFPEIYRIVEDPQETGLFVSYRERVYSSPNPINLYPFQNVREFCARHNISRQERLFDLRGDNYVIAGDGGEKYLDTITIDQYVLRDIKEWDREGIIAEMQEGRIVDPATGLPRQFGTDEIQEVNQALLRLAKAEMI